MGQMTDAPHDMLDVTPKLARDDDRHRPAREGAHP